MSSVEQPLVTPEAFRAFTQRLVALFSHERVILFGSLARGTSTWDSDADILQMVRSPQEVEQRFQWGDPFIREAIDQGVLLHG